MAGLGDVLESEWAARQRALGGALFIIGLSGRIHHADPEVSMILGRKQLPKNAFDLIAPGHILQATGMVAKHVGRQVVGWFPMTDDSARTVWCRFHVAWPRGLIALALWPEMEPSRWTVHAEAMPA